jgi:hypothetical protein
MASPIGPKSFQGLSNPDNASLLRLLMPEHAISSSFRWYKLWCIMKLAAIGC